MDEDALICDLAQVYGVLDHEKLPPWRTAVLAKGLPATSRIMQAVFRKMTEEPAEHITLAEFEAERERYIKDLERRDAHGSD